MNNTEKFAQEIWQLAQESYPNGSPWTFAQFVQDLKQETSQYLYIGTPLKAFLSYQQVLDEIEIFNVAVALNEQRKGLGQELITQLMALAKQNQVTKIFLEVRSSNDVAQKLYGKMGFEVIGTRKNYYNNPQEDALIMEKKVRP